MTIQQLRWGAEWVTATHSAQGVMPRLTAAGVRVVADRMAVMCAPQAGADPYAHAREFATGIIMGESAGWVFIQNSSQHFGLIQFSPVNLIGALGWQLPPGASNATVRPTIGIAFAEARARNIDFWLAAIQQYYARIFRGRRNVKPHQLAVATFYPAYLDKDLDTVMPAAVREANPRVRTLRDYVEGVYAKRVYVRNLPVPSGALIT